MKNYEKKAVKMQSDGMMMGLIIETKKSVPIY